MKEGVDAGGRRPSSRPDVLTAPGGAREYPSKAHVRREVEYFVFGGDRHVFPIFGDDSDHFCPVRGYVQITVVIAISLSQTARKDRCGR